MSVYRCQRVSSTPVQQSKRQWGRLPHQPPWFLRQLTWKHLKLKLWHCIHYAIMRKRDQIHVEVANHATVPLLFSIIKSSF